jgi:NADP-dependent 3-hydroxy acid dehydrogenase YdfG
LKGCNALDSDVKDLPLVATEIFDHMPEEARPGRQQAIAEPLTPEDVARAVVFMLEQPPHVSIPTLMVKPTGQPM